MRNSKFALFSFLTLLLITSNALATPISYDTSSDVPNFGQHSNGWCWVASASNSAYWWAFEKGYESLVPASYLEIYDLSWKVDDNGDPLDDLWYDSNDPIDNPPEDGYLRLLYEFASGTFHDNNGNGMQDPGEDSYHYSEIVHPWNYYLGLKNFFGDDFVVKAVGHHPGFYNFGSVASFNYIVSELLHGESVQLMITQVDIHHVITATGFYMDGNDPSEWYLVSPEK